MALLLVGMRQGRYVFATSGCKHEVTVHRASHGVCRELETLDKPNPFKLQVRAVLDCAEIGLYRYASVLSIPSLSAPRSDVATSAWHFSI